MAELDPTPFEAQFERRLAAYAAIPVRPVDAGSVARDARARGGRGHRVPTGWFTAPADAWGRSVGRFTKASAWTVVLLVVLALALAAIGAGALRDVPNPFRGTPSPLLGRNGAIAFSVHDMEPPPYSHVHLANFDGTEDREITQGACPAFSTDGGTLAYLSGWRDSQVLHVADADGSRTRDLTDLQGVGFALSPDGSQVVSLETEGSRGGIATRGGLGARYGIMLATVTTGERRVLVPTPQDPTVSYGSLAWSPDGRSIAYAVNQTVFSADNSGTLRKGIDIVDVASGTVRHLTTRVGTDLAQFAWAPDGRTIAFTALPDGSPEPSLDAGSGELDAWYPPLDLFIIDANGTGEWAVTTSPRSEERLAWSPDGAQLAYAAWDKDGPALAVVEIRAGDAVPLATSPVGFDSFSWSPDGSLLLTTQVEVLSQTESSRELRSTIASRDPMLEEPPTTLLSFDHGMVCGVSWQRLDP